MRINNLIDMLQLREALEAAWQPDTANLQVHKINNPALGQCYPTARIVQRFFPAAEIVEGEVITPIRTEKHFWNIIKMPDGQEMHIDFTWQQFPHGSSVKAWRIRDRKTLGDSDPTLKRVALLLRRVEEHLAKMPAKKLTAKQ